MALALVLLTACDSKPAVNATGATPAIVAAPPPAPGDTACPSNGLWARCSVIKRLEQAGLNVRRDSITDVEEKPLAIRGFQLPIARGKLRVFLYADSVSRRADEAKLDTATFITPAQPTGFGRTRTIVHSANLLVLMDILAELNRERIANNLMAGPPQPPSNRP